MSSIRVIVYNTPQANVVAVKQLYYQQYAPIESGTPGNPHFIGRFTAPRHNVLLGLRQTPPEDTSSSAVETNVHVVGRFAAARFNVLPLVRQQQDVSTGAIVQAVEIPTHFIGKFTAPKHRIIPALRQNEPQDTSSSAVETNTHFIGKFTQPTFSRFNYNHGENVNSSTETNTHFIGRFTPDAYRVKAPFYNTSSVEVSGTPNPPVLTAEADIQVIPFEPTQANPARISALYYWNPNLDFTPAPSAPETNVSFIATFTPYCFNLIPPWGTAQDMSSSAVETNTHFLAKFSQPQFNILQGLRQQDDWSASTFVPIQPDGNVHFVPRYTPVRHNVLPLLRSNIAVDTGSSARETNTHFLGRFTQPRLVLLPLLRQRTADDFSTSPPANVQPRIHPFFATMGQLMGY